MKLLSHRLWAVTEHTTDFISGDIFILVCCSSFTITASTHSVQSNGAFLQILFIYFFFLNLESPEDPFLHVILIDNVWYAQNCKMILGDIYCFDCLYRKIFNLYVVSFHIGSLTLIFIAANVIDNKTDWSDLN